MTQDGTNPSQGEKYKSGRLIFGLLGKTCRDSRSGQNSSYAGNCLDMIEKMILNGDEPNLNKAFEHMSYTETSDLSPNICKMIVVVYEIKTAKAQLSVS